MINLGRETQKKENKERRRGRRENSVEITGKQSKDKLQRGGKRETDIMTTKVHNSQEFQIKFLKSNKERTLQIRTKSLE